MPPRKKRDATSSTNSDAPPPVTPTAVVAKPATAMTLDERVEQVVRWLLSGVRDADIVDAIRFHWPEQELKPLVSAAIANLTESADLDPQVVRGWCFEATKSLYQEMRAIGDFTGALRAIKQLADLAGR